MTMACLWQVFFSMSFFCVIATGQIQYSIFEEAKKGSVVGNVSKDLGLDIKDLIVRKLQMESQSKTNYFDINLENGNLYVIDRIDRETICGMEDVCFLYLEILAENPINVFSIQIEIQDINDNPPTFSKNIFHIAISEYASPGSCFSLGKARDPDLGLNSLQTYNLTSNQHFKLGEKISTDGIKYPELVLQKALDREKQNSYKFILTASDGGKPAKTGTAVIEIIVQDVNDNYPLFNRETYKISLNEDVPIGFLVLHFNASDADEGSNAQITYSFSHIPENAKDIFSLDYKSGDVKTIGSLDFELVRNYEMTVEAADGGGLVSQCALLIHIVDINDNAPKIQIKTLFAPLPEDASPGTLISLINVIDVDSGKNGDVVCEITEQLPFKLISTSNSYYKLVSTGPLDRELFSNYNITIKAEDKGYPVLSSQKTIQLLLSDVNDNAPLFKKSNSIAYVPENNPSGSSIHRLYASDLDINENAQIVYSVPMAYIKNIPITFYVSINSETGVLYAQRSFDYEQLREFQFQVMAKDRGSPPLSNNITMKIYIMDKNDNAPKILYPSTDSEAIDLFEFIPHSSEKGYLITKVIAVDADSGHNAWLSYHLQQASDSSFLTIGQHTGEIWLARDLHETDSFRQKLVVIVKDNGVLALSATVTLNLFVAENFQQVLPEVVKQPRHSDASSNVTFYLVIATTLISCLFIVTVVVAVTAKCRKANTPVGFGILNKPWYPQLSLKCPSQFSDASLPFPFSYDVCVTLDSRQNEVAYFKPIQNVPTDNLIDTADTANESGFSQDKSASASLNQQAQPNTEWRFSQAQRPGPSGAQPTEEAGVWPNNQFETERLQAMILASANEAAEGTSGLGGGTGTMGLSARYGPQFTLQHVPDYRQNVYIPGSTLTPTNGAGKREGKASGNKKKSGKKEKK
ncbi:protocadherin gamma-B2-like isoform X35 [Pelobates fuscus]|uniref:protocadherin gamma-B2-like isoform X35 n=1 Tax=Pelobates fuscus TaxID=191477 RepID=UPI002FE4E7AD